MEVPGSIYPFKAASEDDITGHSRENRIVGGTKLGYR